MQEFPRLQFGNVSALRATARTSVPAPYADMLPHFEEVVMEELHQDQYVVFVRDKAQGHNAPHLIERELVSCGSYEEARWVRQEYGQKSRDVIIRYIGEAGGGD